MRPTLLKVAGLNSFREEQQVNFAELCQGGVFGIFGPTGSGKSSLLDAITLALYGRVERAPNNTQGIMNQAEDQLSVSFSFELRNALGVKSYRVERRMKRTDEVRVRTVTSRLVEVIGEEEVVLADKDRDVTRQVEEILGLTADDFTRAVVLPQGRFAEFLSLKGVERRQMLQRLFHLEQYGDVLNMKLRRRVESTRTQVGQIEAEQLGLGEAADNHVQLAKERVEMAEKEAELCHVLFEKARQAYEEAKSLIALQGELATIEKELQKLTALSPEMDGIEGILTYAKQAESLRPYVDSLEKAELELKQWERRQEQASLAFAVAEKEWQQVSNDFAEHSKIALEEEPRLTIRMQELKQGIVIQQELKLLEEEMLHLQEQEKKYLERITEIKGTKEKAQSMLEKAILLQGDLQKKLQENTVPSSERDSTTAAIHQKRQILMEEKRVTDIEQEWKKKEKEAQDSKAHLALLQQSQQEHQKRIQENLYVTETLYNALREWENRLEKGGDAVQIHRRGLEEEMNCQNRQYLAHQLAVNLQEGQPCPVCGSSSHPSPSLEVGLENKDYFMEQQGLCQELQGRCERLFRSYREFTLRLDNVSRTLYDLGPGLKSVPPLPGMENEEDMLKEIGPFTENLSSIHEIFRLGEKEEKRYQAKLETIEQAIYHLRQQSDTLKQQEIQWKSTLEQQEKGMFEQKNKWVEGMRWIQEEKESWMQTNKDLNWETIEDEGEKIRIRDQLTEEIGQRLKKSNPYIEEKNSEIKNLDEQQIEIERNLIRIQTERSGKEEVMIKRKQDFLVITGEEGPVEELLSRCETQLVSIKNRTLQLTKSLEEARTKYGEQQKDEGIATQAVQEAVRRKASAWNQWEEGLDKTDFETLQEAKEAMIPQEEQNRLSVLLEDHKNQVKKCQIEQQRVYVLLNGQKLTDDQWNIVESTLKQTKGANEQAHIEKIRAIRDLEDVQQRHARWLQLEKERKKQQSLLDRLLKLQQVLKGNAFVEFIAEEQLINISYEASARLGKLTRQRYALEVDSTGGFVIRDNANGGVRRPVSTLSGGETFLTSLALALALSSQIQLRGEYPLEFFFLDEGFGTLDQELLDTVVTALEKLHSDRLAVGIISHVPELRARLPRRLVMEPAEPSGRGSRVKLETM